MASQGTEEKQKTVGSAIAVREAFWFFWKGILEVYSSWGFGYS